MDGEQLSAQDADCVAQMNGYLCVEQLVEALEAGNKEVSNNA